MPDCCCFCQEYLLVEIGIGLPSLVVEDLVVVVVGAAVAM